MSSSSATPNVDELRERGAWSSVLDKFAEWDPDWTERCARMTNNPWTTGVLPVRWIELICIALNAACTHRNEAGVQRHVRAALEAGASRDEILDTFKGVSVLGIHSVAVTLPILFEEGAKAGVEPAPRPVDTAPTPVIDQLKAAGIFNHASDAIYELDPRWLEEFLAMGADMYRGVLPTKLVELMAVAVDASCTHLYTPGIRRHIQGALAQGATIEEILEVLKLCGALGVDACELGAPILSQQTGWSLHGSRCRKPVTPEEVTMEAQVEELGPVDIVAIAYPAGAPMTGDAVPMLLNLVDRGIIRVLDALFVIKEDDGTYSGFEATDLDDKNVGDFAAFEGASSGLLGDDDVATAADGIEPGSAAVILVFENRWAAPFAAAVRRNGGTFVDFQRVPVQDVIASLEAAEAAV